MIKVTRYDVVSAPVRAVEIPSRDGKYVIYVDHQKIVDDLELQVKDLQCIAQTNKPGK